MEKKYISCAQFVAKMKRKYPVNPVWVWDMLEEEFNYIKGLGCVISVEEAKLIEETIKDECSDK